MGRVFARGWSALPFSLSLPPIQPTLSSSALHITLSTQSAVYMHSLHPPPEFAHIVRSFVRSFGGPGLDPVATGGPQTDRPGDAGFACGCGAGCWVGLVFMVCEGKRGWELGFGIWIGNGLGNGVGEVQKEGEGVGWYAFMRKKMHAHAETELLRRLAQHASTAVQSIHSSVQSRQEKYIHSPPKRMRCIAFTTW